MCVCVNFHSGVAVVVCCGCRALLYCGIDKTTMNTHIFSFKYYRYWQ